MASNNKKAVKNGIKNGKKLPLNNGKNRKNGSKKKTNPYIRVIKLLRALLVAVLVVLVLYLVYINACLIGSGNVISERREIPEFSSIIMSGFGNIHISQGTSSGLIIEAEDNIVPYISTKVDDEGTLKVDFEDYLCINPEKEINIYVGMREVKKLSISGSGGIVGDSKINSEDLELTISGSGSLSLDLDVNSIKTLISGSGNAVLSGNADNHEFTLSGSGNLEAYDLDTLDTQVIITGSGNANVKASGKLDVYVSGSGNVKYMGTPEINQKISGSGSIEKQEEQGELANQPISE